MLRIAARIALEGVGDAARGEWEEMGRSAFHLRRRLSAEEETAIGPAVDVRGTAEADRRFCVARPYLPSGWRERIV
jgi:hypothetical protein